MLNALRCHVCDHCLEGVELGTLFDESDGMCGQCWAILQRDRQEFEFDMKEKKKQEKETNDDYTS